MMIAEQQQTILLLQPDGGGQQLQLRSTLERAGFRVVAADSGEQILLQIPRERPCLVILDSQAPGPGPLGLAYEIHKHSGCARLPLILTAAHLSSDERVYWLESGIDLCLEGVPSSDEFVARVRALIRRR